MAEQVSKPAAVRSALRGAWAVVMLFATAADVLVTAAMGLPPVAWMLRRVRRAIGDEYRRAWWDAIDADAIDADVIEPGQGLAPATKEAPAPPG
jgi:hypothetical protein